VSAPAADGRHRVSEDEAGLRLDAWLVRRGFAASAAAARRLIAAGSVRVDGAIGRKGAPVRLGQTVACEPAAAMEITPEPEAALSVLWIDDDLVAVNKAAGVPVHPLRPGDSGTLAAALIARFPECARASHDPREAGFVHRLDNGTSGVIVAARNQSAYDRLRVTLAGGDSEKRYVAEVTGAVAEAHVVIDVPIGRQGRRGGKVLIGRGRGLLPARTEVFVKQRRATTTLVEVWISAGRAHQIRAHLAHLGHPIVDDPIYGDEKANLAPKAVGIRLHALEIRFAHPVTGTVLTVTAPAPPWAVGE
jgi:23S rRNA pseudouridine1911/1915/1917 synthase